MRKIFAILLSLAILFSLDCKDWMSTKNTCHLKQNKSNIAKLNCHEKKANHKKDCDCPNQKATAIVKDSKTETPNTIQVELLFHSPLNTLQEINPISKVYFLLSPISFYPYPQTIPTKTIHLLI